MNLIKLFDMQYGLDQHIINEHPELKEKENLSWKVTALLVEIGECANEWRGFKKWSNDQAPRTMAVRKPAMMEEDKEYYNPLLEEYVDCLHFILSIGLELGYKYTPVPGIYPNDTINLFIEMNYKSSELYFSIKEFGLNGGVVRDIYQDLFDCFLVLGKALGFTWEEIEQAYIEKNKINHQRQDTGY